MKDNNYHFIFTLSPRSIECYLYPYAKSISKIVMGYYIVIGTIYIKIKKILRFCLYKYVIISFRLYREVHYDKYISSR